jgi:hypothetical protein
MLGPSSFLPRIRTKSTLFSPVPPTPAIIHFKRHCDGLLAVDDRMERVRFVIDPITGCPVMPVDSDVPRFETLTLFIPDEDPSGLQLLGEPAQLDPDTDACCDRYLIYFGPPSVRGGIAWIRFNVTAARFAGALIDVEEVAQPNAFLKDEPGACKQGNSTRAALTAACERSGAPVQHPVLVGVDPLGADIRASFGIVRIEWPNPPDANIETAMSHLLSP